ncbi:MAG: NADH-quinone oxidoreductase subunit A [Chloroflexi bacterium]|jgi:NADH dehydrogenase subunit A (EC 1.6.5.3)|nr:MAG: NADH-quinone oxidoreductase subunit A [Chloroflexi bacterium OLB13]MBC6957645.1 NADH-quinone oxidoreductase subunit A [Chloroflexota bacterium]MBV6435063.1 NAD(P)H-quinone oxidoreductase subunit 3, chloroplastic [Anaerolineae bacterium]MDL1917329.1 NADH-quinone oxidoreductase subunit A [Anaerolineae bacterium CFX4]OQY81877.1 MAG: NADH-quinone oxidoreductase subunit A [Anaerolineae bacterium UTCFX5]
MALQQFAPIAVMIVMAVALTFIILVISRIFGPYRPTSRKNAPYESGMKPIGPGTRRMPVKFYLVAVLFILFDIEVIFFLPYAVVLRDLGIYGLVTMGLFLFILTVGLVYEWKKGALEWE